MSPDDQRIVGLVEDDPIMGESLVKRLALEGITVRWWQRGRDALDAMASPCSGTPRARQGRRPFCSSLVMPISTRPCA